MDWFVSDMDTNLWLYPRGLERNSNTKTPFTWKSKYGSVVTTIYEGAAADGMNEKGLVATCFIFHNPSIRLRVQTTSAQRSRIPRGCNMCSTIMPPRPKPLRP